MWFIHGGYFVLLKTDTIKNLELFFLFFLFQHLLGFSGFTSSWLDISHFFLYFIEYYPSVIPWQLSPFWNSYKPLENGAEHRLNYSNITRNIPDLDMTYPLPIKELKWLALNYSAASYELLSYTYITCSDTVHPNNLFFHLSYFR